jgi:CheY-like chemotaxis protein
VPKIDHQTILIVDDEEASVNVLKLMLEKSGFKQVEVVHTGSAALKYLGIPAGNRAIQPAIMALKLAWSYLIIYCRTSRVLKSAIK